MPLRGGLNTDGKGTGSGGGIARPGDRRGNIGNLNNMNTDRPSFPGGGQKLLIGRDIINKVLLLSSFVFGAVGAIAARKVYDALVSSLYRPVVIMLTIGTLFAIIGIANILFHVVRGIYSPSFSTGAAFAIFAVY